MVTQASPSPQQWVLRSSGTPGQGLGHQPPRGPPATQGGHQHQGYISVGEGCWTWLLLSPRVTKAHHNQHTSLCSKLPLKCICPVRARVSNYEFLRLLLHCSFAWWSVVVPGSDWENQRPCWRPLPCCRDAAEGWSLWPHLVPDTDRSGTIWGHLLLNASQWSGLLCLYDDLGARLKELRCMAGAHTELVSAATTAPAAFTPHPPHGHGRTDLLCFLSTSTLLPFCLPFS